MMSSDIFPLAYAALAVFPASVQLALALGAPWGALTLGGRWRGRLPTGLRLVALLQAALLLAMAAAILQHGGWLSVDCPPWSYSAAVALTALSLVANALSPSKIERSVWTPVLILMLFLALLTGPLSSHHF